MNLFEFELRIPAEDIEFELRGFTPVPWAEFLLNPRRLRGSDFLMRWSQGVWSEERLVQAVNQTGKFLAIPYGPSGTAPDNDPRAFELYFERLEKAGYGRLKRPDLLIFAKKDESLVQQAVKTIGGYSELPFTPEDHPSIKALLSKALLAVECENSLWRASQMPNFGSTLKPQRRLKGQMGLVKSAVLPTIILKEEDRTPLKEWQKQNKLQVHIWHVFYDMAFGISLSEAEEIITKKLIAPTIQTFQAPGGATTKKIIYKIYYHYAYALGKAAEEPTLVASSITDKNGHILPYVKFQGGSLKLDSQTLAVLNKASEKR